MVDFKEVILTQFPQFKCPKIGDKYKLLVKGLHRWTAVITVCKNDGYDYHCYECERQILPGEVHGRVKGKHFCIECVSAYRLTESPVQK
jgi:hypothetical protein